MNRNNNPLLIIQPSVGIGDLIWVKPWLDAILEKHENTVLMTKPSAMAEATFAEHKNLRILSVERATRGKRGHHDGIIGFFRMAGLMRATGAGEVWILHRSWRYAAAAICAGIKRRSGYGFGKQSLFLNDLRGLPPHLRGAHPRDVIAAFAEMKGVVPDDTHPKIRVEPGEIRAAKKSLGSKKPVVVLGVGASEPERQWSPVNFAMLLDDLNRKRKNYTYALCGSQDDVVTGQKIVALLSPETPRPQMIFNWPLRSVIALMQHGEYYIGNDTSLLNIAAAVGKRCLRILASDTPVLESPLVFDAPLPDPARIDVPGAIDDITAASVSAIAEKFLK